MTNDERPLYEIVEKPEVARNSYDSATWTVLFAEDADFIHKLGGYFQGREAIERGHPTIFDTIYKGSQNQFQVEKVRLVHPGVPVVFLTANLTRYLTAPSSTFRRFPPSWRRGPDGHWQIAFFQNTLVTAAGSGGPPDKLVEAHPYKGDTPVN